MREAITREHGSPFPKAVLDLSVTRTRIRVGDLGRAVGPL
jgi:hypothetical protein